MTGEIFPLPLSFPSSIALRDGLENPTYSIGRGRQTRSSGLSNAGLTTSSNRVFPTVSSGSELFRLFLKPRASAKTISARLGRASFVQKTMKILALDTGGVSLPDAATIVAMQWDDGDDVSVLALETIVPARSMGGELAPKLEAAVQNAGWAWDELDGLVVGIGPGSWTSLRVGMATMKTLAQTLEIPLAGVPSFDALAAAAHRVLAQTESSTGAKKNRRKKSALEEFESQLLVALAPCRPGEFYGKIFLRTPHYVAGAQKEWIAPAKTHVDAAYCQMLADGMDAPLILCGSGTDEASTYLAARDETHTLVETDASQVAIELAIAGAFQIASGEIEPLEEIAPLYLAPSNAERVREAALSPAL